MNFLVHLAALIAIVCGVLTAFCWFAEWWYSRPRVVSLGFVTCICADCEQEFECFRNARRYCDRCAAEPGVSHYESEPDEYYEDREALR